MNVGRLPVLSAWAPLLRAGKGRELLARQFKGVRAAQDSNVRVHGLLHPPAGLMGKQALACVLRQDRIAHDSGMRRHPSADPPGEDKSLEQ